MQDAMNWLARDPDPTVKSFNILSIRNARELEDRLHSDWSSVLVACAAK